MENYGPVFFFCLIFSLGYNFQISESYPQPIKGEDKEQPSPIFSSAESLDNINVNPNATTLVIIPRQEDEDDEENRKSIVQGVGNILTGAFALDLKKVLKGAFSFADKDVQDNILNVIVLGKKPPISEPDPTTPAESTTESLKSKKNETIGVVNSKNVTAAPGGEKAKRRPIDPLSLVFPPAHEPTARTSAPETTTEQVDEEDDEEFEDNKK